MALADAQSAPTYTPAYQLGSQAMLGGTYQYSPGQTQEQNITANGFSPQTGYGFTNFANPVGGIANAYGGLLAYNKNNEINSTNAYNAAIAAQQQGIASQWGGYSNNLLGDFATQQQQQQGAVSAIEAAYTPNNAQQTALQNTYGAQLQAGLAQNTQQYQQQSQGAALSAMQSGLGGSSVDAEQQAQIGAGYQSQNDATQNAVYNTYLSGQQQLQGQEQNLLLAALSGNPQQQAAYGSMAQSNTNQAQILAQQAGFNSANAQLANAQAANQSQMIGNALTTAGNAYSTYNSGQAYQNAQASLAGGYSNYSYS